MPCSFAIQIDNSLKITNEDGSTDWTPCLKAVALELQSINTVLATIGRKEIQVNPDATDIRGFLGTVNTPPNDDPDPELEGMVTVYVPNYDYINSRLFALLPTPPQTFWIQGGVPPQCGGLTQ